MSNKNQKIVTFFKKNAYYFVFLTALAVIVAVTVGLLVNSNNSSPSINGGVNLENPSNTDTPNNPSEPDVPSGDAPANPDTPDVPTVTVVVFDMPVANGTVIKNYVDAGVVYNETLNLYTGHKAIDFTAEEGASVVACYDGVVESVIESKLDGVTVTIDHGNGLKSHYNSIEVDENIVQGVTVKKGDKLGEISINNRTEYKDGAHLHFYVTENDEKINPEKYLLFEEK